MYLSVCFLAQNNIHDDCAQLRLAWFSLVTESESKERFRPSDIEHWSCKRSHKLDRHGVGRIRTLPFSSDSAYGSDACNPVKTELSGSQAEVQESTIINASSLAL